MPTVQITLTEEFRHALDLLDGGRHLFLTGKAGTGKSTLVRQFMASTSRRTVVVAPTGIAALNVGGYTIHRLFGFHPRHSLADVRAGDYYPGRFAKAIAGLQTLVVDEASMVRADMLDKLAAALERFGPHRGEPFGGVQVVLVGDLFQLPPVVADDEATYLQERYDSPYFFSADAFDRERFPTVALTHVFRQEGDDAMTAILNDIREGVLLGSALETLNARTDPAFVTPEHELWLTLATTNRIVTARNRQRLEQLPGEEVVSTAVGSGDLSGFDPPGPEQLRFKVGAQVMMLANDPADRWVNGSLARVVDAGGAVLVETVDGLVHEVEPVTWDATRPVVEGGHLRHETVGRWTQLPFTLAWAITIHKSQGQTVDRLVVDLSGGTFDHGQLYVALSRCTSLAGLVLRRPVLAKDMKTDRRVVRFLRTSTSSGEGARFVGLGVVTIGEEGRRSRPRPVELALAFDDGTAVSTLINPQRDLGDARRTQRITVTDALLAPSLLEAWALLRPLLAGCTPVGHDVDTVLSLLDFELKRLGHVTAMPLGLETGGGPPGAAASALDRARAALAQTPVGDGASSGSPFEDETPDDGAHAAYLLSRDPDVAGPVRADLPALTALLDVSRQVGRVVLADAGRSGALDAVGATVADAVEHAEDSWHRTARRSAVDQLVRIAPRAVGSPDALARLRAAAAHLGAPDALADAVVATAAPDIDVVLVPGARVCFTGEARMPDGRWLDREEAHRVAASAGLLPVPSVTKTRCDALVTAEPGTQSGKARKAAEYGKPVFSAEEFFAWLGSGGVRPG